MCTTTSDDEETGTTAPGDNTTIKKQRYKRRKVRYSSHTVLRQALFHSATVPEQDSGNPSVMTGLAQFVLIVSAVGQVVLGRFYINPPGLVERLNSNLPSQIRIIGYK
ncbi:hypothetical protein P3X46_001965 [Hevea brasiliensis]|uniref:Uncharacterized protein n=1 Tax=Hevea brasiliensis TaxID=3981 RepID=A0ABQ9N3S8_HEVBR|nr:hypothetical protein P3X46_001965 [Hevea brasiliensis]